MRYNVFISYRHGDLDGLVAEKLHKMLETYRVPGPIAKASGMKRLRRVFRDREELPTSSNLSDSINEALESSEFLMLICSRRTRESQWVMREVERFSSLRGKDRIITLLIDGEPDDVFPPALREREINGQTVIVEPLAADIRAKTPKESLKLLNEEKLRLLAPVLGCAFDDLRRRHRRRRIMRIVSYTAAAFIFSLTFGTFSTYQYLMINREMQMKLYNQSCVLAEYSAAQLKNGNIETAMQLAITALPHDIDKPDRPFAPAAQSALADALGVYDITDGFKYHRTLRLPLPPNLILLSPNERYIAACYPHELAVYDTESGELLSVLPSARTPNANAAFLNDDVIVYAGLDGVTAYNIADNIILWQGDMAAYIAVSKDGRVIASGQEGGAKAALYSSDGAALGFIDFVNNTLPIYGDNEFMPDRRVLFELDETGENLAASLSDGSLSVFKIDSGLLRTVFEAGGIISYMGGFTGNVFAAAVVRREPYLSEITAIDTVSGEQLLYFTSDTARFIPFTSGDTLFIGHETAVHTADITQTVLKTEILYQANDYIETIAENNGAFIITEETGRYYIITNDEIYNEFQSDYVCHFARLGANYALTASRDVNTVRILKKTDNSELEIISYKPFQKDLSASRYWEARIGGYDINRAIFYNNEKCFITDLSSNPVAEVTIPDPLSLRDRRYDKAGTLTAVYDDRFLTYSVIDGALLRESYGNAVMYTDFGVNVCEEGGAVKLYSCADGSLIAEAEAQGNITGKALLAGGNLVSVRGSSVYFNEDLIGEGDIIGASKLRDDLYAFAISDETVIRVFTIISGELTERFECRRSGFAQAFFCGDYVFIAPFIGNPSVYTLTGEYIRELDESGSVGDVYALDRYIAVDFDVISSSSVYPRYTLLLTPGELDISAVLPGFMCFTEDNKIALDDRAGALRTVDLREAGEMIDMAREYLSGRVLTDDEMKRFNIGPADVGRLRTRY